MIKKVFTLLLVGLVFFSFGGCKEPDHDQLISEMGEKNRVYHEKRQKFLDSEVYQSAVKHIDRVLKEQYPDCEYSMSLEPGRLLDDSLDNYSNFSDNAEIRAVFFKNADLYIKVNFWDYGTDAEAVCKVLMENQLSGRLAADKYEHDYYRFDSVDKEASLVRVPEV